MNTVGNRVAFVLGLMILGLLPVHAGPPAQKSQAVLDAETEATKRAQIQTPPNDELRSVNDAKDSAAAARVPDDYKVNLLIRTTVIAINQANKTGNYTVLRDLGSPGFQKANTAATLAEKFSIQRSAGLDFAPVLFFNPTLMRKPELTAEGRLKVSGYFPTQPQQVNFNFLFEFVDGEWRHFALGLGTELAAQSNAGR